MPVQALPGSSTTLQLPFAAQQAPVPAGAVKSTIRAGRGSPSLFSRVLKRFTTRVSASFPITIQP
jgi:hypothetical protein